MLVARWDVEELWAVEQKVASHKAKHQEQDDVKLVHLDATATQLYRDWYWV